MEVTLRHGQEQAVPGTVLRLSFMRVIEDSRCPINAVCVWMGDGVAEVGIRAGMGPTFPLRLHTSLEPHSADWNSARVTLLELSPSPLGEPIAEKSYAVRLRVESLGG
jgi:hypothetical protein